jgi:hypothetical protein
LVAGTAVTAIGIVAAFFANNDQTELTPMSPQQLENEIAQIRKSIKISDELSLLIDAFIMVVKAGDYDRVKNILIEMKEKDVRLDPKVFKQLIRVVAAMGRVKALEMIGEYAGVQNVESDPLAKKLLRHPMRDEIERLSGQFIKGLGNIKEDGERAYLAYCREKTSKEMLIVPGPAIQGAGTELAEDYRAFMTAIKEEKQVVEANKPIVKTVERFDNTVVIAEYDQTQLMEYLQIVEQQVVRKGSPVISSYIVAGGHFTSGDINMEITADGKFKATILHFDSQGATGSWESFNPYLEAALTVVPNIDLYASEAKLQHTNKGCSIFTLLRTVQSAHMDRVLSTYDQYQDLGASNGMLFRYAQRYVTETVRAEYATSIGWAKYTYHLFLPPVIIEAPKQSFTQAGEVEEVFMVVDGDREVFKERKVQRAGHMGLDVLKEKMAKENPNRHKEFSQTMNRRVTVDEYIDRYTDVASIKGVKKKVNCTVEKKAQLYGLILVTWLVSKSSDEINDIKRQHSLERFREANLGKDSRKN